MNKVECLVINFISLGGINILDLDLLLLAVIFACVLGGFGFDRSLGRVVIANGLFEIILQRKKERKNGKRTE